MTNLSVLPFILALLALVPTLATSGPVPGAPRLSLPIACHPGITCEIQNYVDRDPGPGIGDYRCGARTYQAHGGVDFRIPDMAAQRAGVAVLAAAAGRVSRLRDGAPDISVRAPGVDVANRECGNGVVIDHGGGWETQYCHLARGSLRVRVGDPVKAGQALALVGLSGNTEYPHLHLTVRHKGATIDSFAPDPGQACNVGTTLWASATAQRLPYQTGAVLNFGFAAGPVTPEGVEAGAIPRPVMGSRTMVAYVRAIGLRKGDLQTLSLTAPGGRVIAQSQAPALATDKAQYLLYVGGKASCSGWVPGTYQGSYVVTRAGIPVLRRQFQLTL